MLIAESDCRSGIFHPGISFLLKKRRFAIVRRISKSFATRRRFVLSLTAVLLAIVWLANAMISILYREPLDPIAFRRTISLGLLVYSIWHVLKNAFKRPEVAIEWTPAEVELLLGGPFTRRDRLVYRFATIVNSVVIKSLCFAILMLPDLPSWIAGFSGVLLGLLFVDLWKLLVENVAWGMSDRVYKFYRYCTATLVVGFAISALTLTVCNSQDWRFGSTPAAIEFAKLFLTSAASLRETWIGIILETPFLLFSQIILAHEFSANNMICFATALALVALMGGLVLRVDQICFDAKHRAEQESYRAGVAVTNDVVNEKTPVFRLARLARFGGMGPLVWRQLKGVKNYRSSLLFAMAVPSVLACLPAFAYENTNMVLLNVVGALVFYSFILLPTALKFDFRRDLDRFPILKSLPLHPLSIVIGQLTTPVLVSSLFQIVVFAMVSVFHPIPFVFAAASIILLVPLNVLIFAIENLIFLLFPYRVAQEGFAVFLRSTLTFTAKGVLFLAALIFVVAWAFTVDNLTVVLNRSLSVNFDHRLVFAIGIWLSIAIASICTVVSLTRAFHRFDVSQDMPS